MAFAERFLGQPRMGKYTAEMLQRFLGLQIEEGPNLDYTDIRAAKEGIEGLATAVTAMANSGGGLLVVGVREQEENGPKGERIRIRPGEITWGDKTNTREALEARLVGKVRPWPSDLVIHPIRNDQEGVVFLIEVPQSARPPHQAPDKRYYLRYNFQNLPLDHDQVAALFYKRLRPNLVPLLRVTEVSEAGKRVRLEIWLGNRGGAIGKFPLFFAVAWNCVKITDVDGRILFGATIRQDDVEGHQIFYQSPIHPVHPKMESPVCTLDIELRGTLAMQMSVGAEDMPTEQFTTFVSPAFLAASSPVAKGKPIELYAPGDASEEADEMDKRWLQQLGRSEAELGEIQSRMRSSDDAIRMAALGDFFKIFL